MFNNTPPIKTTGNNSLKSYGSKRSNLILKLIKFMTILFKTDVFNLLTGLKFLQFFFSNYKANKKCNWCLDIALVLVISGRSSYWVLWNFWKQSLGSLWIRSVVSGMPISQTISFCIYYLLSPRGYIHDGGIPLRIHWRLMYLLMYVGLAWKVSRQVMLDFLPLIRPYP